MTARAFFLAMFASVLAACSGTATPPAPLSPAIGPAVPTMVPPAAGSPIQHLIVVIQENRTMDNMFNGFPGASTVLHGRNHLGDSIALQPQGLEWAYDPSHSHQMLAREYNDGKMNGFDLDACDSDPYASTCQPPKNFTYSYVPESETQWLWIMAGAFPGHGYGIADHMFSSRQVPSFPGHLGLIAGQGPANDPVGPDSAYVWGCDSPKGQRVQTWGKTYSDPLQFVSPCFNYNTIADLMDKKGVTWKYYTGAVGTVDGTISAYDAIEHIRSNPADWNNVVTPMTNIFDDIQNGTIPQVSFITPPFAASDHGGTLTAGGPAWVTSIYVWVTENKKLYGNTAILVTWDDSGGWYDHVPPPSDPFGPLGFRVPLLALGPYAVNGVSHTQHDFGSILHFIERNWGLGTLGQRDLLADDLHDMFNYKQKPIPPVENFGGFNRRAIERKYSPAFWRNAALDQRPIDNE